MSKLLTLLGNILCWLGAHDFRVIDKTFGFGESGNIEKVECRRCGTTLSRRG